MGKSLNQKLLLGLVLVLLILFIFPSVLQAADSRVTTNGSHQINPAIFGDRIVYMDFQNNPLASLTDPSTWTNVDIFIWNLATSTETQITTNIKNQFFPDISLEKVVWEDERNDDPNTTYTVETDVYLWSSSTGEVRITANSEKQSRPAISGDKIVWHDFRNGNWDIYLYEISTGLEYRITTDSYSQRNPDISGDKIVWVDERFGNEDIYLYSLLIDSDSDGIPNYKDPTPGGLAETRVTDNLFDQGSPKIYQNYITWVDRRGGTYDIYLYNPDDSNFSAANGVRISDLNLDQVMPAISGERVVWEDYKGGANTPDIYTYNFVERTQSAVTTNLYKQASPNIYGNRVVWTDSRDGSGNYNIYINYLADTTSPTVKSTSPASGAANISIDTKVKATFGEPMKTSTINTSTFYLKDSANNTVSASVNYDLARDTAILTLSSPLANNATYTATVTTGVQDFSGREMASNKIWSFTTALASDTQAPVQVTNLAMASRTSSSITLIWTAPGDDGNTGTASQYDIRYSTSPITEGNWAAATQVTGEPTPQPAGSTENFTVSGLDSETTYYFAMRTADEVPNWSGISNVVSATTLIIGDINGDGRVSLIDLTLLAEAYGTRQGDANYNPDADLNGDGRVSLIDLTLLADNYGRSL